MQVIRTVIWILITAALVAFIAMNWHRAPVNIWPVEGGYLHFEWPIGLIAILFYFFGLIPMWLLHRAGQWRLNRRISALENTVKATSVIPPMATTTQLEAEAASANPAPSSSSETPTA